MLRGQPVELPRKLVFVNFSIIFAATELSNLLKFYSNLLYSLNICLNIEYFLRILLLKYHKSAMNFRVGYLAHGYVVFLYHAWTLSNRWVGSR